MHVSFSLLLILFALGVTSEMRLHHFNKNELNAKIGKREVNIKIGVLHAEERDASHFWIEFDPQCQFVLNDAHMLLPYIVGADYQSPNSTEFYFYSTLPFCSSANRMSYAYVGRFEEYKATYRKNCVDWVRGVFFLC